MAPPRFGQFGVRRGTTHAVCAGTCVSVCGRFPQCRPVAETHGRSPAEPIVVTRQVSGRVPNRNAFLPRISWCTYLKNENTDRLNGCAQDERGAFNVRAENVSRDVTRERWKTNDNRIDDDLDREFRNDGNAYAIERFSITVQRLVDRKTYAIVFYRRQMRRAIVASDAVRGNRVTNGSARGTCGPVGIAILIWQKCDRSEMNALGTYSYSVITYRTPTRGTFFFFLRV